MTILTVGPGQQFTTIHEAVDAAAAGDTIDVQGGPAITYTNDFISIGKSLTLQAVGGEVQMVETQSPGNGKAMIVGMSRRICIARRPKCPECPLLKLCPRVGLPPLAT